MTLPQGHAASRKASILGETPGLDFEASKLFVFEPLARLLNGNINRSRCRSRSSNPIHATIDKLTRDACHLEPPFVGLQKPIAFCSW
jgi:hypothetical protein